MKNVTYIEKSGHVLEKEKQKKKTNLIKKHRKPSMKKKGKRL